MTDVSSVHVTGVSVTSSSYYNGPTVDFPNNRTLFLDVTSTNPDADWEVVLQNGHHILKLSKVGAQLRSYRWESGVGSNTMNVTWPGYPLRIEFGRWDAFTDFSVFWLRYSTNSGSSWTLIDGSGEVLDANTTGLWLSATTGGTFSMPLIQGGTYTPPPPDDDPAPDAPDTTQDQTMSKLDLIRAASSAVGMPVKFLGDGTVAFLSPTDLATLGWIADMADDLYTKVSVGLVSGDRTLALDPSDDQLTVSADIEDNRTDLVELNAGGEWSIPMQLPIPGLDDAPVSSVTTNYTPQGFSMSVEVSYPQGYAPEDLRLSSA